MPNYATPGIYFERIDEAAGAIASIRTDIAAFIGIAQRGPLNKPTPVNSWKQFQAAFGSYLADGYLAYAAQAFFQNGGQRMYAVRVAAPWVSTSTDPSVTQIANGASSVVLNVQGFAPGALVTVKQTAVGQTVPGNPLNTRLSSAVNTIDGFSQGTLVQLTQAGPPSVSDWHRVQAVDPVAQVLFWDSALNASFDLSKSVVLQSVLQADYLLQEVDSGANMLSWETPLAPAFNPGQPMQFESGAGASRGVLYDSLGIPTLQVQASSPGTWGDGLAVELAQTSLAATKTASLPSPLVTAAFSFVESVAGFLPYSLVKAYQFGTTAAYRLVTAIDFSTNSITWDSPLPFAAGVSISFETVEFSLTVYLNGQVVEIFSGLSMEPKHQRYVEKVINPQTAPAQLAAQTGLPSRYIRVRDLHSASAIPDDLPNPAAPQLNQGWLSLAGGRDGIAALAASDFTGDIASEKKWGLRTLEDVDEISIVAVPDILIEPAPVTAYAPVQPPPPNACLPCSTPSATAPPYTPPPAETVPQFSPSDIYVVQQALVAHCEEMQFRFAILDPPDFSGPKKQVDLAEIQSWRNRFDTEFAALYFPWVLVPDPLRSGNAVVRRVPPSGHVAGVYASTDLTEGVFKAPANTPLQWAQDLTTEVTAAMQGFLNPMGVDCLRSFPGRGLRIYGTRTLSSDTSWQFVNVRRLMSMIERAVLLSMQWAVFEPNSVFLWKTVKLSITGFLTAIWKQGALAGSTAAESFFVICDETNNPPATTSVGELIVDIGVAPTLPAEFIVFRIGRTGDTLSVSD